MPLAAAAWPAQPAGSWTSTRDTLRRWLQLVGTTSLARKPLLNQWGQVPLVVMPQGLSTGAMPYAGGLCEVVFDWPNHHLRPIRNLFFTSSATP